MDNTLNKLLDDLKKVNQINNEIIKQQLDEIKKLRSESKKKNEDKGESDKDDPLQRFTDWWFGESSKKEEKTEASTKTLDYIYKSVSELSQNINEPIAPILKDQLGLLQKIGQDIAINRKVNEGSLEYDKASAQYRNQSGREITSDVSGKTIKEGGYIDFETAGNSLAGQSKAAIERAKKKETTNLAPVSKKPTDISVSEEDDNVQSAQEIMADNSKTDLELTKEIRDLNKEQLEELKKITDVLGAGSPGAGLSSTKSAKEKKEEIEAKEENSGLGDALSVLGDVTGQGKKGKVPGKAAGKASLGSKALKFLGGKGGLMVGGALAVGAGAYTAYKGFTGAEEEKQKELAAVDQAVQAGEITPEEADAKKKEIDAATTEKKGGAVGEGTGMAAGAIGGAKIGATIGTMFGGPIGTAVGGLAGGAIGAFVGSKAGKAVGELGGKAANAIKGFFGGEKKETAAEKTEVKFSEAKFAESDPENYKKFIEYRNTKYKEIIEKSAPKGKIDSLSVDEQVTIKETARQQAQVEAVKQFNKEIEAAGAGAVSGTAAESSAIPAESITGKIESKPASVIKKITEGAALGNKSIEEAGLSKQLFEPKRQVSSGISVAQTSTENRDLERATTAVPQSSNTIINNSTPAPSSQTIAAVTPQPRNDDPLGSYFVNRKAAIAAFI